MMHRLNLPMIAEENPEQTKLLRTGDCNTVQVYFAAHARGSWKNSSMRHRDKKIRHSRFSDYAAFFISFYRISVNSLAFIWTEELKNFFATSQK